MMREVSHVCYHFDQSCFGQFLKTEILQAHCYTKLLKLLPLGHLSKITPNKSEDFQLHYALPEGYLRVHLQDAALAYLAF